MKSFTKSFEKFSRFFILFLLFGFVALGAVGGCNNDGGSATVRQIGKIIIQMN